MPRTHVLLAALLGCSALALAGGLRGVPALHALGPQATGRASQAVECAVERAAEPRFLRPLAGSRDCKPLAPVELLLQQVGAADGSVVELEIRVQPRGLSGDVTWELRLPAGAALVQGEARGSLPADGVGGPRRVRVRLDPGAELSRITLVASAALAGASAGADVVQATRSLSWGDPQAALASALPARHQVAAGGTDGVGGLRMPGGWAAENTSGPRVRAGTAADRAGSPRLAGVPVRHRAGR